MSFESDIPMNLAVAACSGTSFTPERRAASACREYAQTLAVDYERFKEEARKGGTQALLEREFAEYRCRLAAHYRAWLVSSSRCVSTFIAGPSNFPARRMNKRADIAHRRLEEYLSFRERARARVVRTLRPDLAPIKASDVDAIERYQAELARLELRQRFMVLTNRIVRAAYKAGVRDESAGEAWGRYLERLRTVAPNISDSAARELLVPKYGRFVGFQPYELNNNGANIRRIRERIEQVTHQQASPVIEHHGAIARLVEDPPANRVRLHFVGMPPRETRDRLKAAGFRWTPSLMAWQAYRNHRALDVGRREAGCAPS